MQRSPFKTTKGASDMPPPDQPSDKDAASARSDNSNSWTMEQKEDIYNRRQEGEDWESIWESYPHRSKHALQQQFSIMKKIAPPRPSVKTSRRGRTATGDTSSTKINGNHDVLKDKPSAIEDSSGDDQDEADSEAEEPTPTKAVQPLSDESDQSAEPRKTRPAQKARSSKRLTRNAEVEADEESPGPGTPPSTRPRRARASGKNYNMLAKPEDFEESADEPRVVDPLKSPKKSRIVALRVAAGVPKKATPDARSPRAKNPKNMIPEIQTPPPRKTRRAASANNDHEAASTVASNEEISPKRMSTRLKEANEGNPAPDEDLVDQLRRNSGPGKRRRHVPSKLNLEQELLSKAPSAKTSRKRKLSEAEASETLATPATADSAAQTTDDDEKQEPRRRVAKHKEHLGFLPNGQPRKRRRRRTRQQIEIDQANGIDHATYRKRNRYQFPYLEGYVGPDPPDEAAILARQEEYERQNPTRASTSESESSSSLDSLDEDEESLKTPAPDEEPETSSTPMEVDEVLSPVKDTQPLSIVTKTRESTVATVQSTFGGAHDSLDGLGEMLFLPEDLAKARENAAKYRAALEEEKKSFQTKSGDSEAALLTISHDLEEEVKKSSALTAEVENVKRDLDKTRIDLGRAKDNNCGLKVDKQQWKTKHDTIVAQIEDVQAQHEPLRTEVGELKELNNNLQAENEQLTKEMSKEKEQLTAVVVRLTHEHSKAGESLSDSQKQVKRLEFQNQSFRKDIEYLKQRYAEEKTELKTLADRDLRSSQDSSKACIADRDREIRRLKAEIDRLESAYDARRVSNTIDLTEPAVSAKMPPIKSPYPTTTVRTPTSPFSSIAGFPMGNMTPVPSTSSSTTVPAAPRPPPPPPPSPYPYAPILSFPFTTPTTTIATNHSNPAAATTAKYLNAIRNAHIRLAGHLRTTSEAFTPHQALITKFSKQLKDDDVTMRNVKGVVKDLALSVAKVEGGLKVLREASEVVKGEVLRGLDGV
ncbi:MAG: hypothetical protein LQ352_005727 [Teloschistes flavicans]|nr:MAG: hypothetical protein LQ352_005727 [Teloschistes flavicans]